MKTGKLHSIVEYGLLDTFDVSQLSKLPMWMSEVDNYITAHLAFKNIVSFGNNHLRPSYYASFTLLSQVSSASTLLEYCIF